RDLFGELCAAARQDGLVVLARMDSNRATEGFYRQHPEWFARQADGSPYRAGDRYVACIFSDYYEVYLTGILREIVDRYAPDGFTDNSWSGLDRASICFCDNCRRAFEAAHGYDLPTHADWDSPIYRVWMRWNYDRRLAVWDLNNRATQEAGGPHCLWLGMNSGNIHHQALRFRDHKAICERAPILMLDHQRRGEQGFQQNGDTGKLCHELMGWDALMPESMSQYQSGTPTFRLSAKPEVEARLWMLAGLAGGIHPWWHFISAYHEDRRQYRTAVPVMQWVAANQEYLLNRQPVASVGVVWSQENVDYFGRDQGEERVMAPYYGVMQALIRARIPYLPVHADHIERAAGRLAVLVLPNLAAMSDAQIESVRRFVAQGGGLVATGESSLYTGWGDRRADFGLADVLGVHGSGEAIGNSGKPQTSWETYASHTYLRLHPGVRGQVDGPLKGDEPVDAGPRHAALAGFEETDILGFGGKLAQVTADAKTEVPLTFIPAFPIYPPEFSWMREPDSGLPALVLHEPDAGG
ncbi:MAG: Tat pathway signal protein, partial [Chloroflexi bacterium]